MLITRTSILDNQEHTMEMPVTGSQLAEGLCLQDGGMTAGEALPTLTEGQVFFLQSGITPEAMQKEMRQ